MDEVTFIFEESIDGVVCRNSILLKTMTEIRDES
jgi:hypothetical protein